MAGTERFTKPLYSEVSVESFRAWVRSKPSSERYVYSDCGNCAFGQFLKEAHGYAAPLVGGSRWSPSAASFEYHEIPEPVADALEHCDRTFGGLLRELETA